MKLTRLEFKNIIKSCIKELIKEGAFDQVMKECLQSSSKSFRLSEEQGQILLAGSKKPTRSIDNNIKEKLRASVSDDDEVYDQVEEPLNPGLVNLIENTAGIMAKGDKNTANAYAEIFADTAINTLPQQLANDVGKDSGYGAIGPQQGMKEKVQPEQLKSLAQNNDMGRWARVAFGKIG